VLNFDVDKH